MSYVESYILLWQGICIGIALGGTFFVGINPMPRRWAFVICVLFIACAFLVRPFIGMLIEPTP